MDKIAVVTPVYNGEKFISECVESVKSVVTGGVVEVEHVVVDDGSSDETVGILKKVKDPKLKIVYLDKNSGAAHARNVGLENTLAEWVFFLDSDDLVFSNSLRHLLNSALERRSGWVYGDFVRGDALGRYQIGNDYYGWQFESVEECLTSMFSGEHFFQQNSLYKRDLLVSVGGFDEKLHMAEDFDLTVRLLLMGLNPVYVSGALYMHRNHEMNLSRSHQLDADRHRRDVDGLYQKYKHQLEKKLTQEQMTKITRSIGGGRRQEG